MMNCGANVTATDVTIALAILADGQWHTKRELCAATGTSYSGGSNILLFKIDAAAESDSGNYACIPDHRTPTLAPDGT